MGSPPSDSSSFPVGQRPSLQWFDSSQAASMAASRAGSRRPSYYIAPVVDEQSSLLDTTGQRSYHSLSYSVSRDNKTVLDGLAERGWYNQFTSTDWMRDTIADAFRLRQLRSRSDWRGILLARFDSAQGWLLAGLVGFTTAVTAYLIVVSDRWLLDMREGYCAGALLSRRTHCQDGQWVRWASGWSSVTDFAIYATGIIVLAAAACAVTLQSETVMPTAEAAPAIDEDLSRPSADSETVGQTSLPPRRKYYTAAGSGVAEVRVVLSGFVLHGYLGLKTLLLKSVGLVLSVAAGLCVGKEGPSVHIAACIGNISCRLFAKYNSNDGKRREILSASAAGGVAVAFGAPIGGVLFSLEEVSYYFPPKTLFRTFFCCIAAALTFKFLNPYGSGRIALFEVRYLRPDWAFAELPLFVLLGFLGGALGALFIKASRWWANRFRSLGPIRRSPMTEVCLVGLATAGLSFGSRLTALPAAELMRELVTPCGPDVADHASVLCPRTPSQIRTVLRSLAYAFVAKAALTVITFGIKVPAGIYVPSMVVGGLLGRFVGHTAQLIALEHPDWPVFAACSARGDPKACFVPGVFALAAAGATMCGVTRLSLTLAIILFELTGSLDHVLPFSVAILVSKWTADAIEPLSIYDLLTHMNSYPFLDNKSRPLFSSDVGDLVGRSPMSADRLIDISSSLLVPATELQNKLDDLHRSGQLDGALPVVHNRVLVGLVPAPDLEYGLDRIRATIGTTESFANVRCAVTPAGRLLAGNGDESISEPDGITLVWSRLSGSPNKQLVADFTQYVNPAPIMMDVRAPMDQMYEHFTKLGLRHVCVLDHGNFVGLVHKKAFVRYINECDKE